MSLQQHKILRQVLEVRGCPEDAAARIGSVMRRAYFERIVPAIDRLCSSASAPDRVHRIERLEIDLGEVPLDAFESALAGKFEAAFAEGLAAAVEDAPQFDADLELFSRFIATGTVPWWAELSARALLETSLERLIERSPHAVRHAILHEADRARVVRRLVRAYPDRILRRVAEVLAPALPPALAEIGAACAARNLWWEELFRALAAGGTAVSAPERLVREILRRVAERLAIDYRLVIEDLRRSLPAPSKARAALESLSREMQRGEAPTLERTLARLEAMLASYPGLLARLREIRRLPAHLQGHAAASLEAAVFEAGLVDVPAAPAASGEDALAAARFSDADEIYVGNAGLVILWPFLERFFANVALLEEKAFKDEAARQRAVGLLQYLATGEAPEAEHLLPLNKVLCGMALEEVFDFGAPMSEVEIEACDELLAAVIRQAPILNEMSIAGFRASFLLRKGQLGARDDHWLLRVERETHDVVLDRFPWSAQIVKLPWMEALLQVEW